MPKAESVVWSFAGRELNFTSNNTPFYVQEEYTAERVVSTVTLLDPISTYFGDYNCTVTNSFGTDSVIIKLTAHSKFIPVVSYSLSLTSYTIAIVRSDLQMFPEMSRQSARHATTAIREWTEKIGAFVKQLNF